MKNIIRLSYYLTLLLLLGAVSGCTKTARASRAVAKADDDLKAGRYERAEIGYRQALRTVGSESPTGPDILLKLGQVYHAQGRWSDAVGYLNAGLRRRTNDVPSKAMASESLFLMGYLSMAFETSAAVLQMQPGHPEAMIVLVESFRPDEASLAKTSAILNSQPEGAKKTAAYRTAQGTLLLRAGKLDAAEKEYAEALKLDPKFYPAHLGVARVCISRKESAKAKAEIMAAIAAMPNRSGAISVCLDILSRSLGEKEEAKRVAGELTQKNRDFIPPYLFLATVALNDQQYDESLSLLKKVLATDPASYVALTLCGDVSLARNDGTNALRFYQQAASGSKGAPPALLVKLGYALFASGDLPNAKTRFREALNAITNAIYPEAALALADLAIKQRDAREARELTPKLSRLITEQPQMLGAYIQSADLYLTQSDFDNAIQVTRTARQRFPNEPELPYRLGSLYNAVSQRPGAGKEFEAEARKAFEQALGLAPHNLMYLSALIGYDLGKNRYDDAYKLISSSIKDRPDVASLYYLQGMVLQKGAQMSGGAAKVDQKDKIDAAIGSFRKAIDLAPTNQEAYFALAQVYIDHGRHKEALAELQNYLGKTNSASAHLLAAQIHEQLKDYAKAAEEYEKIVAMNQRSVTTLIALNNLACDYGDHLGRVDEAYALAQRAREMDPRSAAIAETLGWAAFRKGDYSRALSLFQEAAADKDLAVKPEFLYHFAMANYMAGEEEIARDMFQQALRAASGKANAVSTGSSPNAVSGTPAWVEDAKSKLSNLSLNASAVDPGLEQELKKRLTGMPGDPVLLRRLGMVQERNGDYKSALTSYETALKSNPKHAGIQLHMAVLYAGPLRDLARGLELAKQVRSAAPNDPEASRVVGQLAYRSRDYRLAAALLEESAKNYPDDASLSYDLGAALYSIGRVAEAEQAMRKAAESGAAGSSAADAKQFLSFVTATKEPGKHPEVVKTAIAMAKATNNLPAMMVVAVDAESRKDQEKAVKTYVSILKDYPLFCPASRNLGLIYFSNAQDREKAYEPLNKVREQYSEDPVFCRALGILTCQRGDYARAAQLLQPGAEGSPGDPEALFYLGKAQINLKKPEARGTLGRALQGSLSKDLADEARTLLRGLK